MGCHLDAWLALDRQVEGALDGPDHGGLTDVIGINVRICIAWFVRAVTFR